MVKSECEKNQFFHIVGGDLLISGGSIGGAILPRGYFTIFCNSISRPSPIRVSHTAHTQKSPLSVLPYQPLYFHLFRSSLSSIHHPQYIPCSIHFILYPFLSLSLNPKKPRNLAINHNINIQVPKSSILKRILKLIQIHSVN